jgi:hypothetical protein
MLPGFNTDVQYRESSYHIQTEDNGEANPIIVTLIYHGGAILARKKADYRHLLGGDFREKLRKMMREQHRKMIKMLLEGRLESQLPDDKQQVRKEENEGRKGLDKAIMDFLADIED